MLTWDAATIILATTVTHHHQLSLCAATQNKTISYIGLSGFIKETLTAFFWLIFRQYEVPVSQGGVIFVLFCGLWPFLFFAADAAGAADAATADAAKTALQYLQSAGFEPETL